MVRRPRLRLVVNNAPSRAPGPPLRARAAALARRLWVGAGAAGRWSWGAAGRVAAGGLFFARGVGRVGAVLSDGMLAVYLFWRRLLAFFYMSAVVLCVLFLGAALVELLWNR